jgi:hypothetical protein
MYNLGVLFTQGMEGISENHELAFEYFSKVICPDYAPWFF